MVVGARPEWIDWVAGLAPVLTAVIAAVAVVIASKALKASQESARQSRRSADNSAANLERADTALRSAQRPLLLCSDIEGLGNRVTMTVTNVGPGLSVRAYVTCATFDETYDDDRMERDLFGWGRANGVPPLAPGASTEVTVFVRSSVDERGSFGDFSFIEIVLMALDVNDDRYWTHYREEDGKPWQTNVGGPDVPRDVGAFVDYTLGPNRRLSERQ